MNDLRAVLDVWDAASRVAHPFLDEAFLAKERREIAEVHLPNAETWVCELGGVVAGFVALVGEEVGGLFVHPEHHRKGIGRALMDHSSGLREVLYLDVFEENRVGRAFYDRYGFEVVGERVHEETGRRQLRMHFDARFRTGSTQRSGDLAWRPRSGRLAHERQEQALVAPERP
jgi:putative acetyltransferase